MFRTLRVSMFAVIALLALGIAEISQAVAEGFLVAEEHEMHAKLNETRTTSGLAPLPGNDALRTIARRQSQSMAAAGYIFHTPDLVTQAASVSLSYDSLGENVGVGASVSGVHEAFLASPGHRGNIVDPGYNAVAVGAMAGSGGSLFFSQNFAALRAAAPPPAPAAPQAPAPEPTEPPAPPPTEPPAPPPASGTVTEVQDARTEAPSPLAGSEVSGVASVAGTALYASSPRGRTEAAHPADGTSDGRASLLRTLWGMMLRFLERVAFWK